MTIEANSLHDYLEKRFQDIAKTCDDTGLKLRHDKKSIWVSDIEEAYFCERKLDLSYFLPPKRLYCAISKLKHDAMKRLECRYIGFPNHDKEVEPDSKEIRVLGIFNGIPIGGTLDQLEISGNLITVVERKFRSAIPYKPDNEHEVQGRAYCYCLDYMLADSFPYTLDYRIEYYYLDDINGDSRKFWTVKHYDQRTKMHMLNELDFVAGYWIETREAKAQKSSKAKCKDCEYNEICESCLANTWS